MSSSTPQDPSAHPETENTAESGATVGIQAQVVRDSNVFIVPPDATPQKKYEIGKSYLSCGVPFKAEELISAAIAEGFNSAETQFYRLLAVFSKRSYRDLGPMERDRLDHLHVELSGFPESRYRYALEAIAELIPHLRGEDRDVEAVEKKILALDPDLLELVQHHLALVLSGTTQDKLWERRRQRSKEHQCLNERLDRAWAYYHSDPVRPRSILPFPSQEGVTDWVLAIGATLVFAASFGYLGWLVMSRIDLTAIVAFAAAFPAGYLGLRAASDWRYAVKRVELEDLRNSRVKAGRLPRKRGFTRSVSLLFEYYFEKFAPEGYDADAWLKEVAGVRGRLRDEVVLAYRESRIPVQQVSWLIHYLARDTARRWESGTLYEYRDWFFVSLRVRLQCALGVVCFAAALLHLTVTATPTDPFATTLATLGYIAGGLFSVHFWYYLIEERRRAVDDERDYYERITDRYREYERWKEKLRSARPTDSEMEAWLDCDKTILIDQALQHYRLTWHDVIGHAVLPSPAFLTKAGRVRGGPWRYARYNLRLFLITEQGVREVVAELDFKKAEFVRQVRNNFRFDALSTVEVVEGTNDYRALSLTLNNGPTRWITLTEDAPTDTDAEESQPESDDLAEDLLAINLSAAGFTHALQILEGIAAEGKGWAQRHK